MRVITSRSMLFFSLDTGPDSLPPPIYRLFDNGLFEVSLDLH